MTGKPNLHGGSLPGVGGRNHVFKLEGHVGEAAEVYVPRQVIGTVVLVGFGSIPVARPVLEVITCVGPVRTVGLKTAGIIEQQIVAVQGYVTGLNLGGMPVVTGAAALVVEAEQDIAVVPVHERGLTGTGSSRHLHLTGQCAGRNFYVKRTGSISRRNLDRICTGELHGERSGEVRTGDGYHIARLSPLEGHGLHLGYRRQHLEVEQDYRTVTRYQVNLIVLLLGQVLGNAHDQRVGSHITGIQNGWLIVEVKVMNAGEILTDKAHDLFHKALGNDNVSVGIANVVHGGYTGGFPEAVRVVNSFAGSHSHCKTHENTGIFKDCFHGFRN